MTKYNDILVSQGDAEVLATLVGERGLTRVEADAAGALADALLDARMVPDETFPEDRVAMNCLVSYEEQPGGVRRRIALVHPSDAAPAEGRISVLSPVGRALLGRQSGSVATIDVPGGRSLRLRVLSIENRGAVEAA